MSYPLIELYFNIIALISKIYGSTAMPGTQALLNHEGGGNFIIFLVVVSGSLVKTGELTATAFKVTLIFSFQILG